MWCIDLIFHIASYISSRSPKLTCQTYEQSETKKWKQLVTTNTWNYNFFREMNKVLGKIEDVLTDFS